MLFGWDRTFQERAPYGGLQSTEGRVRRSVGPRNVPHAWKNTGKETGRVLFLYTPAAAGGLIEELSEQRAMNHDERGKFFERHHWKIVGPNPL